MSDDLAIGTQVGAYLLRERIGVGGGGAVYAAEHQVIGRPVAIKVMHRELAAVATAFERFVREARAVHLIRDAGVIDVLDFGRLEDGRPYYVMELLVGETLESWLARRGRLSLEEVLPVLEPVARALEAAHAAGFVHRDVKASNVHVSWRGAAPVVKLLDFGIAKLLEPGRAGTLTTAGRRLGTVHAMSPEQVRGETIDRRTDIYAFGALLYRLLTGEHPFDAEDPLEIERAHLFSPVPAVSERAQAGSEVDDFVRRCMAKAAADRFESMAVAGAALLRLVRGSAEGREVRAVGVWVEALLDGLSEEALQDPEVLDVLGGLLEVCAGRAREAALTAALETTQSALFVRTLPDDPERARAQRAEILDWARRLHAELEGRSSLVPVTAVVHCDRLQLRVGPTGAEEPAGGALLRTASWLPARGQPRLVATASALEGLVDSAVTRVGAGGSRAELARQVDLAASLQQSLVPGPQEHRAPGIRLAGYLAAAGGCGGDFWTFHRFADDRTLVVIGDATGHGVSSAFMAAVARGCVEAALHLDAPPPPDAVLTLVDAALRANGATGLELTCLALLWDPARALVQLANGGHPVPLAISGSGNDVAIQLAPGGALGGAGAHIVTSQVCVAEPLRLVLFTDGLVEGLDGGARPFGARRLRQALRSHPGASTTEARDEIVRAFEAHLATRRADDDVTCVVVSLEPLA